MTERLDVSVASGGDGDVTVTVAGEIDMANAGRLRDALGAPLGDGRRLVVDLTGVTYMDSAGIAALFERAASGGLEVRCRADSVVAPLIEITRLDEVAAIRRE